jgi:hypothetical protein
MVKEKKQRVSKSRKTLFLSLHEGIMGAFIESKEMSDNPNYVQVYYIPARSDKTSLHSFLRYLGEIFKGQSVVKYPYPVHKDNLVSIPTTTIVADGKELEGQIEEYMFMIETKDGKKELLDRILGYQSETIKQLRERTKTFKNETQTVKRELQKTIDSKEKQKAMEDDRRNSGFGHNPMIPSFNPSSPYNRRGY